MRIINIITAGNFTATVGTYFNNNIINAASFTATVGEDFNNTSGGRINATSFTLTASNFYNFNTSNSVSTINATSFTATVAAFLETMVPMVSMHILMQLTLLLQQRTLTLLVLSTIDAATM